MSTKEINNIENALFEKISSSTQLNFQSQLAFYWYSGKNYCKSVGQPKGLSVTKTRILKRAIIFIRIILVTNPTPKTSLPSHLVDPHPSPHIPDQTAWLWQKAGILKQVRLTYFKDLLLSSLSATCPCLLCSIESPKAFSSSSKEYIQFREYWWVIKNMTLCCTLWGK